MPQIRRPTLTSGRRWPPSCARAPCRRVACVGPTSQTYEAVAGWLESELDAAWARSPNVGRINAVHRLNRTEYNNAVNDLLGLDVDVIDALPGDETMGGGFDNVADALSISPLHMERYLSVARTVTRLAVGLPPAGPGSTRYAADDAMRQNVRMSDDLPLGSRGGMAVRHTFPVDGEYRIRVRLQKNYAGYAVGWGGGRNSRSASTEDLRPRSRSVATRCSIGQSPTATPGRVEVRAGPDRPSGRTMPSSKPKQRWWRRSG